MDLNTRCRHIRTLIAAIAIIFGGLTCGGAAADYQAFTFSAMNPYYSEGAKVDFGTYNGFRRYHSECHVCHGPAGLGSSYAPALLTSVKTLSFHEFVDVIVRGRVGQNNLVMPGFAGNMNVLPYLQDIYAYLMARSDGVIGPARPQRFPKIRVAGMSGTPSVGMTGMAGMAGMAGMSGAFSAGPDGSVYLFPAQMGGMSGMGMGGMSGMGMGGISGMGMGGMSGMGMGGMSGARGWSR